MSTPDVNEWAWLEAILDGIDKDEAEDGWWETSTGAEFGARKLVELKQAIAARIAELEEGRDLRLIDIRGAMRDVRRILTDLGVTNVPPRLAAALEGTDR